MAEEYTETEERMENVEVRISAREIVRNREGQTKYNGEISFNGHYFQYDFTVPIPVDKLDELAGIDAKRAINLVNLNVQDYEGKEVVLDEGLKALFMATAGRFAFDTYHNPESRYSKEGVLGNFRNEERKDISRMIDEKGIKTNYTLSREIPELGSFIDSFNYSASSD